MKPGPNQFKIFDNHGAPYQPDFVVETDKDKLIIEVKRKSEMMSPEVLRKAEAASLWSHIATTACASSGEKAWSYLLVPETDVDENFTIDGLKSLHLRLPSEEALKRYEIENKYLDMHN
jgi:type III restriction enzyme